MAALDRKEESTESKSIPFRVRASQGKAAFGIAPQSLPWNEMSVGEQKQSDQRGRQILHLEMRGDFKTPVQGAKITDEGKREDNR